MTSSTCIRPAGITSYLLMSPFLVVFAPLKAAVHGVVAGADALCIAACFTVAIYPWFYGRLKQISSRNFIIRQLISAHALPWFIQAVQFRQSNDHFISGRVRSWLGRKSWETAARMVCAEAPCLGLNMLQSKRSVILVVETVSASERYCN